MEKKFVKEMDIDKVANYKRPHMILLSGFPGSGKTYVAKALSKKYQLFLLSNDYVRNYCFSHNEEVSSVEPIEMIVKRINKQRLLKLLNNKKSFIFDRDINTNEEMKKFILLSKTFGYDLIAIKLNSNDKNNIERVENRFMDIDKVDKDIVGDNVEYSTSFTSSTYFKIKERKPRNIDDDYFDYVIDNNGTLENLDEQLENIMDDMSYHLKKR